MFYLIAGLILFICFVILFIKAYQQNKQIKSINYDIEQQNKKIIEENKDLTNNKLHLLQELSSLEDRQNLAINKLNNLNETVNTAIKEQEETLRKAASNYCKLIENDYQTKEEEYKELLKKLDEVFYQQQFENLRALDEVKEQLEKIRATRAAAVDAQKREQEIKDNIYFYCLQIPEEDKKEISIIKDIEYKLRDPRPVRMLIWSSYYLKRANDLAGRVLGNATITGIYKITNQKTQLSYIGQARDMRERWREHMKFGLGIDTPANNPLYQAMKTDGLENFTFELLEKCETKELDEKEKFYISLYDSYTYGYNSNSGVGKKGLI